MRMISFLLFLFLVSACYQTQESSPAFEKSPRIVEHFDIIKEERIELPIPTQKDYSSFYLSKSNFIYTAGVPIEKIISILKPINPEYFKGITRIEFVKINKFISNSKDGWYYSDNRSIRIFVDNEGDEFLTRNVLHEIKHYYCLTKERDSFNRCLEANNQMSDGFDNEKLFNYCYHKEGCFLNTPIDEEYGFIR